MKRHSLLILLAAFSGIAGGIRAESLSALFTNVAPAATPAVPRRPNILWIVADSLGYGDLSCYGQTKYATPNLDRLAAGGARFTRYATGAGAGSSAQAVLLFGQEMAPAGQRQPGIVTVTQELKRSGYHTGLIGQWELGNEASGSAPWDRGFDEFAGYFDAADAENYYVDYIWRYAPRSLLNATNNRIEDFVGREMLYSNVDGLRVNSARGGCGGSGNSTCCSDGATSASARSCASATSARGCASASMRSDGGVRGSSSSSSSSGSSSSSLGRLPRGGACAKGHGGGGVAPQDSHRRGVGHPRARPRPCTPTRAGSRCRAAAPSLHLD